jgi:hypothetical protein
MRVVAGDSGCGTEELRLEGRKDQCVGTGAQCQDGEDDGDAGLVPREVPERKAQVAVQRVDYLLLNRLDPNALIFTDESSQVYRDLAGGLPGSTITAQACFTVNNPELVWANATPVACNALRVQPLVTASLCGLDTRFESTTSASCTGIAEVDTLATIFPPDPDVLDYDIYTDYTGTGRRIITIPIVDVLTATNTMTVLGFRQFLVSPTLGGTHISTNDTFGRFVAMYIGSVAPLRQGRFNGCQQASGPGKVVLHQ